MYGTRDPEERATVIVMRTVAVLGGAIALLFELRRYLKMP
jgi:hypothetical protein